MNCLENLPYLPTEIWDKIFDIKFDLDDKENHKTLTNKLNNEFISEVQKDDDDRKNILADIFYWLEYNKTTDELINLHDHYNKTEYMEYILNGDARMFDF